MSDVQPHSQLESPCVLLSALVFLLGLDLQVLITPAGFQQ